MSIFSNLQILPKTIQSILDDYFQILETEIKATFDMNKLNKEMEGNNLTCV